MYLLLIRLILSSSLEKQNNCVCACIYIGGGALDFKELAHRIVEVEKT